jgi:hypothetical protein
MQSRSKTFRLSLMLLTLLLTALLGACRPATEVPTPTTDPQTVLTAAASTASFRLTQAGPQTTPTATFTPGSPTPDLALTAAFSTVSAQLTQSAALTPSPTAPQLTPITPTVNVAGQAERATYVADVTVPDGTDFNAGATFTKTWRLKNDGSTTWTTAYTLAFISGEKLGGPDRVNLPLDVAPGATVDVSVNLVAPSTNGTYRGYWKIVNASGQFVNDAVYVEIDVVSGAVAATVTPGGPTATSPGDVEVTDLFMAVDDDEYTGACPRTFTFTSRFTLNRAATVTYKLEAASDTPGFVFTLPAAQTSSFPAGTNTLTFSLNFSQSVDGWVSFHVTSPGDETSNRASFVLTCE